MGINKGADEINNKEEKRGKEAAFKTSAKEDEAGRKKKAKNPGSSSSRLTGIPGLVLLFLGFLLSYYVGARETGVFFLLFFLLCFASACWSRGVCRRICVEADAPAGACYAGQVFSLKLKVQNRSFFPLIWLDLLIPAGEREIIKRRDEEDASWFYFPHQEKPQTGLRQRFVWLLWHQEILWEEELTAMRRGCLHFSRVNLQAGDGFGLSVFNVWRELEKPVCVYLYPAVVPVRMERFFRNAAEAIARSRGETEDITLLKSTRSYTPGDPAKRINWRLLAASGKMQVNLYETVQPGCAAFILDLKSFRRVEVHADAQNSREIFLMRDNLENMISVIASCMKNLIERRIPVALLIPAYGRKKRMLVLPGEADMGFRACMEALSLIDYCAEDAFIAEEDLWRIGRIASSLYFCVGTDQKNELEEQAVFLGSGRATFLAGRRVTGGFGIVPWLYLDEISPVSEGGEGRDERIS